MDDAMLPAPVRALVEAINEGDTEAFVDAFTEDGRIDDWGRVLTGPEGIRSWATSDAIGMQAQIDVTGAWTDGDTTRIVFNWTSNRFNGESEAFVAVAAGGITEFRIPSH